VAQTGYPLGRERFHGGSVKHTSPTIFNDFLGIPAQPLNFGVNGHTIRVEGTDIQMKLSSVVPLLFAATLVLFAQEAMPRMSSVDPTSGKAGDVIAVTGENLDKGTVGKVYLTDGKNDFVCEVTEQTATSLKIKIPAKVTGRMALMILTVGKEPKLIEQPVKVTIE
jgi:IPT/TIG domain